MADPDNIAALPSSAGVLYYSPIEIGRLLLALAKENIAVLVNVGMVGNEQLFTSHILFVNPAGAHFIVAYSDDMALNSVLLEQPTLKFTANYQGAHLAFLAYNPVDVTFAGHPAVQVSFPQTLLLYRRRIHPRIRIPNNVSLHCTIGGAATAPFETRVLDISRDGMSCMLYKGRIALAKGTVLKESRIILPNGKTVGVDLVVRYAKPVTLRDGSIAHRTGMHFIQTPKEIEAVIDQLVRRMNDTEI